MREKGDAPLTFHFLLEQKGGRCHPATVDVIDKAKRETENRFETEIIDADHDPTGEPKAPSLRPQNDAKFRRNSHRGIENRRAGHPVSYSITSSIMELFLVN